MKNFRNRQLYLLLVALTVLLGLASRKYSYFFPNFINSFLGDTLWAVMIFLLCASIFNRQSTLKVALIALGFAYCIEISQLYHAPWIEEIRRNRLGGLVLGYGFLWSDILSYSVGVILAAALDKSNDSLGKDKP